MKEDLMSLILSPENLNTAYRQVIRNHGTDGVDKTKCEVLLPYLHKHKDEFIESIRSGRYKSNPVCRVKISKDNSKTRQFRIPTVVDRLIQQALCQVFFPFMNVSSVAGIVL